MPRHPSYPYLKLGALLVPSLLLGAMMWWLAGSEEPVPSAASAATSAAVGKPETPRGGAQVAKGPMLEVEDVFARFDAWAAAYEGGALEVGLELAQERRVALKELISKDPRAALERALPWTLRRRMPAEVTALLETRVSATGEFSVMAGTPQPGSGDAPVKLRSFDTSERSYVAYVYGRREYVGSKMDFPVDGVAVDEALAVRESPTRFLEPEEPAPAGEAIVVAQDGDLAGTPAEVPVISGGKTYRVCCAAHAAALEQGLVEVEESVGPAMDPDVAASVWTEGPKKTLVIRVDFSDLPGTPVNTSSQQVTPAFVTGLMNGVVANYMSEVSYRKTSITQATGDVTAVLRLPRTAQFYATDPNGANAIRVDALAAATAAGFNINSFDRQLLAFSNIGPGRFTGSRFTWAGLGQLGAPFTWYNGYFQDLVVVHELGHNLGVIHASLWRTQDGNPVSLSGAAQAYGDPFDAMGANYSAPVPRMNYNPWFLNRMDWLPNAAIENVAIPGTYRIYRYDHPDAPLNRKMALRVAKDATRNYWIGYRRQYAGVSGALADVSAGAYIIWGFNNNTDSLLIDCDTPTTNAQDASLNVGNSLQDIEAGITFTVRAAGGTGVDAYLDIEVIQTGRIFPLAGQYDVDEAAGSVTISLARAGQPTGGATVQVTTQNGTAVAPGDYTAVSTSVSWIGADTSAKTVTIPIVSDSVRESAESFLVNIVPAPGSGPEVVVVGSPVVVTIREPGMADGSLAHDSFTVPSSTRSLALQPEGQIVFTGEATRLADEVLNGLGRLEMDGSMDATFNQGSGMSPVRGRVVARQADGKLIFGGNFTSLRDGPARRLARLFSSGSSDPSFQVGNGPNQEVRAIAIQADGRILIGGAFTAFNGTARRGLARLLADGSLDTSFLASPIAELAQMEVEALALQPDGKVLVAGSIRTNGANDLFPGGFSSGVLRLHSNGTVDTSFDIGAGAHAEGDVNALARVYTLLLQPDGKVLVGGDFTGFRGVTARRVARLNANGTLDTGFQSAMGANGPDNTVHSMALQADGRILLAGGFNTLAGVTRNVLARLLPGGAVDTAFETGIVGSVVNRGNFVTMQPDGRILLATEASGTSSIRRLFSGQQGRAGVLEFVSGSYQANEGGGVTLGVRRVGGSVGALSVNYATVPASADETDFVPASGTLTWVDGDTNTKTFTIAVPDDGEPEPVEFFSVQLGGLVGAASLGQTSVTSVAVLDPGGSAFARVRFTEDSSHAFEFDTSVRTITVEMTPAQDERVTIPFTLSGTATLGVLGDCLLTPASPLIFEPGETAKTFSITVLQDKLTEGNETVMIQLGFPIGKALLAPPFQHVFTIVDDDTAPGVSATSLNQIVVVGQQAGPFEGDVTGSAPLTLEWQRNGRRLPNVLPLPYHLIPSSKIDDAGEYRLVASNKISKNIRGQASHLVVVDTRIRTVVVPKGGRAVIQAEAGGNGIGFEWRKAEGGFPTARATTRFDRKLTLSKLELEDSGVYICRVSNSLARTATGDLFMDAGPVVLKVVDTAPLIGLLENDPLPGGIVGGMYRYPVPFDPEVRRAPIKWTATGLPPGLKIDAATGEISGRPTAPDKAGKAYPVTLTASNNGGKSTVKVTLSVASLPPGLAGNYTARLERHEQLNAGLGGRLDFAVAPTGALSGTLTLGAEALRFTGVLEVDVEGVVLPYVSRLAIPRKGRPTPPPLELSFTLEGAEVRFGELRVEAQVLEFSGWRNVWSATNRADPFAGRHHFALRMPSSIPDVPRGHGYGVVTVAAVSGVATVAGMTSDGEKLAGTAFLSPEGRLVLHQVLYKNKPQGSMNGEIVLEVGAVETDPRDNPVSGSLSWVRPQMPRPRLYAAGFGPVDLQVLGGFYQPQTLPVGLTEPGQVRLVFTEAGLPAVREPGVAFDVDTRGRLFPPLKLDNPAGTTLKYVPATGMFDGRFSLEDPITVSPPPVMKRSATFRGLVVPDGGTQRGYGAFILQQLPSAAAGTTVKTSPFLSGNVVFEEKPAP